MHLLQMVCLSLAFFASTHASLLNLVVMGYYCIYFMPYWHQNGIYELSCKHKAF